MKTKNSQGGGTVLWLKFHHITNEDLLFLIYCIVMIILMAVVFYFLAKEFIYSSPFHLP